MCIAFYVYLLVESPFKLSEPHMMNFTWPAAKEDHGGVLCFAKSRW